ncbi:MAG: ATP synthase F1 subunit gamma [Bacteroidales bacterium]|nr:ATP synthase F1 subunit gamma [Bacteroidales bacterium]
MPSLKEVKRRIGSVQGTMKVTSAMGSISAAKLHKAQLKSEHLLPYQEEMQRILDILLQNAPEGAFTEFSTERPVKKVAVILVSSNKTFCGAFNSNVVKLLSDCIDEYRKLGLTRNDITVYAVGDKGAKGAIKAGYNVIGGFTRLSDKQPYDETAALVADLTKQYMEGSIDRVELIYNHYKNGTTQVPTRETYLPFNLEQNVSAPADDQAEGKKAYIDYLTSDYIVDPDAVTILKRMMPQVLVLKVYAVLLDAATSEHAARMMSMQQATDNGEDLLQELRLQYNKQRQQAITNELLDIVGGTVN